MGRQQQLVKSHKKLFDPPDTHEVEDRQQNSTCVTQLTHEKEEVKLIVLVKTQIKGHKHRLKNVRTTLVLPLSSRVKAGRSSLGSSQLTTGGAGARKQAPQQTCQCSSQLTSSFPFSNHLCRCYLNINLVFLQNNCFTVLKTKK